MIKISTNLNDILQISLKSWSEISGLIYAILAVLFVELYAFRGEEISITQGAIFILSTVFVYYTWMKTSRKKISSGKIGIVICIACYSDKEKKKIEEDLILPLKTQIKSTDSGNIFQVIITPQYIAKSSQDLDSAHLLRKRTNADMLIYGRVRLRELNGKNQHIFDLNGIVSHSPIPDDKRARLAREFGELLPRKLTIPKDNDFISLGFTSDWTAVVINYILGIASSISGHLSMAETLYTLSYNQLKKLPTNFPIYITLNERIPLRLSEIYLSRASAAHEQWTTSHEPKYINIMGTNLDKICDGMLESALPLKAIRDFLETRDPDPTISLLKNSRNQNYSIWHFDMAFLYAYKGDLKRATREYRKGLNYPIPDHAINQLEDFIHFIATDEPDKYQLFYCLGFINWKLKGDLQKAIDDFRRFLENENQNEYKKERELAAGWVNEITATIETSPPD